MGIEPIEPFDPAAFKAVCCAYSSHSLEDTVGFEPTRHCYLLAFEASAFTHSATSPGGCCGIRTHGTVMPTRFPSVAVKPLRQTSWRSLRDLNPLPPP